MSKEGFNHELGDGIYVLRVEDQDGEGGSLEGMLIQELLKDLEACLRDKLLIQHVVEQEVHHG